MTLREGTGNAWTPRSSRRIVLPRPTVPEAIGEYTPVRPKVNRANSGEYLSGIFDSQLSRNGLENSTFLAPVQSELFRFGLPSHKHFLSGQRQTGSRGATATTLSSRCESGRPSCWTGRLCFSALRKNKTRLNDKSTSTHPRCCLPLERLPPFLKVRRSNGLRRSSPTQQ